MSCALKFPLRCLQGENMFPEMILNQDRMMAGSRLQLSGVTRQFNIRSTGLWEKDLTTAGEVGIQSGALHPHLRRADGHCWLKWMARVFEEKGKGVKGVARGDKHTESNHRTLPFPSALWSFIASCSSSFQFSGPQLSVLVHSHCFQCRSQPFSLKKL